MLALSRKPGEKVVIGNGITLTVVEVRGDRVRLAFHAPEEVRILRGELACWQEEPAGATGLQTLRASGEGTMADPSEEIVRVATAGSPEQPHRWRQALAFEGIRCWVADESLGGLAGGYPGRGVPELWVLRDDAQRARAVLEGVPAATGRRIRRRF